jgi:inorganic pyrophosphatase
MTRAVTIESSRAKRSHETQQCVTTKQCVTVWLKTMNKLFSRRSGLAHPWHGVPARVGGGELFNAYIELVPTDVVKYELDKDSGHLRLDRPQRLSSLCPTLYGLIPRTYCGPRVAARCAECTKVGALAGDGDPMDVCVLTEKAIAHGGFLCHMRPVGGLRMIDGDQVDEKIIAVLDSDIVFGHFDDIDDCPRGLVERLQHYFLSYKQRPGDPSQRVRIAQVYDRAEALTVIALSLRDYDEQIGTASTEMECES